MDAQTNTELEMQKEEIGRLRAELDFERTRYFNRYNLSPVGSFTINENGIILEANLTFSLLLGVSCGNLINQQITRFIFPEDQNIHHKHDKMLCHTDAPQTYELRMIKNDGTSVWVQIVSSRLHDTIGVGLHHVVLNDISARKAIEEEQERTIQLIQLVDSRSELHECISALTASLQNWSGCEAVGIRLRSGDDYPYYETRGFPPEFVQKENYLCAYSPDGAILLDDEGSPVLECMCGNILCGKIDLTKQFFPPSGASGQIIQVPCWQMLLNSPIRRMLATAALVRVMSRLR